jgi:hypothetical protein
MERNKVLRLLKSSTSCADMIMIGALAVSFIFMLRSASAQTGPTQPFARPAQANAQDPPAAVPPGEGGMSPERQKAMNDALLEPRKIAAAVVASDFPTPNLVVQVGAFQGEFLEVFLDRFPTARGQWTEAITSEHNLPATKARFARFGDRIDFRWGCARRDLSAGCVLPKDTDVILIEWLSIQQDLEGMYKVYRAGADQLRPGGWIINMDHVTFSTSAWGPLLQTAVKGFRRPEIEGPPVHYPQFRVPTVDEQLGAMRAAGFDAQVVWQSFTTALFIGRKK